MSSIQRVCIIEDCNSKENARKYCAKHLWRLKTYGDPNYQVEKRTSGVNSRGSYYRLWHAMRQRCNNPNTKNYKHYGGRGITVCERWNVFANFMEDMGNRPSSEYTLDRIDNNKGYSPDNCRWATRYVQAINQRDKINNTSGYVGVSRHQKKWLARFRDEKLGYFDTKEEASLCYQKKKQEWMKIVFKNGE